MAKLSNLVAKFQTAVDAHASIKSLMYDYLWNINADRARPYPLLVVVPGSSTIANYSKGIESYRVEMWILNPYHLEEESTRQVSWVDLKDWGHDIIDAVIDRATYRLGDGNRITADLFPPEAIGNAKVIGVKFNFVIDVVDCRNDA